MSEVRDFPSQDSASRQERAEDVTIEDIRIIDGDEFGYASDGGEPCTATEYTVYELDLTNESGERRTNVTIIPSILFESTKDVQHRHEYGIIGKYTRALAMERDEVREEVLDAIEEKRASVQDEIQELRNKDSRLMHTQADLGGI